LWNELGFDRLVKKRLRQSKADLDYSRWRKYYNISMTEDLLITR